MFFNLKVNIYSASSGQLCSLFYIAHLEKGLIIDSTYETNRTVKAQFINVLTNMPDFKNVNSPIDLEWLLVFIEQGRCFSTFLNQGWSRERVFHAF